MSYKLNKPYTDIQRANFVVQCNHNQGLRIEEGITGLYALEAWKTLEGDEVVDNKEAYEAEQKLKEKERIANLSLTKREVFLGLYKALGITPEQIKAHVTDPVAQIEFEYANNYFRGNPLIDSVGTIFGVTAEQLDNFFETKDHTCLLKEDVNA